MAFAFWQRYCTVLQQWESAKLCGFEQSVPPIFDRAAITLGIGPHSSLIRLPFYLFCFLFVSLLFLLLDRVKFSFDYTPIFTSLSHFPLQKPTADEWR